MGWGFTPTHSLRRDGDAGWHLGAGVARGRHATAWYSSESMASLSEAALPLLIGTDSPVEIDFSELRPVDVAEIELTGDTLPE